MNLSPPKKNNNSVAIFLVSILGAAAIICVVVLLTPMDEIEEVAAAGETPGAEAVAAGPTPPGKDFEYTSVTIAELGLPSAAKNVDVETLRAKLTQLAETLRSKQGKNPAAHHIAAQLYMELKQSKLAAESWQHALSMTRIKLGPYLGLAKIKMQTGEESSAIELLEQARLNGLESEGLFLNLAQAHENLGNIEEARELLQQCSSQYSTSPELWKNLARVQMQSNAFAEAEASIRKAIELSGPNEAALFTLAGALQRQKKTDEAREVRTQIQGMQQKKTEANQDGFQERYSSALRQIGFNLYLASASVANQNGDNDSAEDWVREAIAINPNGIQAYLSLASILLEQREVGRAIAVHRILVAKQPENILNDVNLASLLSKVGLAQEAVSTLQTAIRKDPDGTLAQASLCKLYMAMSRPEDALVLAATVVERSPSVESYVLLAATYDATGKIESADAALQKAQATWPDHPMWQQGQAPPPENGPIGAQAIPGARGSLAPGPVNQFQPGPPFRNPPLGPPTGNASSSGQ